MGDARAPLSQRGIRQEPKRYMAESLDAGPMYASNPKALGKPVNSRRGPNPARNQLVAQSLNMRTPQYNPGMTAGQFYQSKDAAQSGQLRGGMTTRNTLGSM